MNQPRLEYHTKRMWISVLLAITYGSLLVYLHTLTGSNTLDGIIGVLLGLYICAHPAAISWTCCTYSARHVSKYCQVNQECGGSD